MTKRTALLAWELGGGLGHARRLLTIARNLRRRGWSPVVAARELWACAEEYRAAGIPTIQAPLHRGLNAAESARFRARSLADIMAACGYRDAGELLTVVSAWDHLIELIRPGIVVGDYAPVLALAAHGRVPMVAVGDGFVLPPPHLPNLPALRRHAAEMPNERLLLANAATVQQRRGLSVPRSLPSLIGGAAHTVCTYPETDIFSDRRLQPASGPIGGSPPPLAPPADAGIFAYLAADYPRTAKLMHVLAHSGFPVEAFLREAPGGIRRALGAAGVHMHAAPPALAEVAVRASVIVHHGGIGTIETSLALGRPQVLLPRHLEQRLNAANLIRSGTGVALSDSFSLAEGSQIIAEAVASEQLAKRAREAAANLRGRPFDSLERIIAQCEALAGAA